SCGAFPQQEFWAEMLWHLQIEAAEGLTDIEGGRVVAEAADLGLSGPWKVSANRGFLVEGGLTRDDLAHAARAVLVDPVVERFASVQVAPAQVEADLPESAEAIVHVLPRPGVTDPEAESARSLLCDLGFGVDNVRTVRTYRLDGPTSALPGLIRRVLGNDAV